VVSRLKVICSLACAVVKIFAPTARVERNTLVVSSKEIDHRKTKIYVPTQQNDE
jgi:hypothetical protein